MLRDAMHGLRGDPEGMNRLLLVLYRIEIGRLPLIVTDERGRVWQFWDVDFEH